MAQLRRFGCTALVVASVGCTSWAFVPPSAPVAKPAVQRPTVSNAALQVILDDASPVTGEAAVYESWMLQASRWIGAGIVIGMLAVAFSTPVEAYNTPIGDSNWEREIVRGNLSISAGDNPSRLEPCKNSKRYAKRIKDYLFKITSKQAKYPEGSVVYNRYVEKIAQLKNRQAAYGDRLCGKKDGLPHVLVTSAGRGGTIIPAIMFIYTTGWIGWAGRSYLKRTRSQEKELNMDVPLDLTCMASGFAWPVLAWQAIVNGEMVVNDNELYISAGNP